MSDAYRREYLVRLPMPLAWLYSRSHNAPYARARHEYNYFLFEAAVRLAAAPLIVTFAREVSRGGRRSANLVAQLTRLARPAFGDWVGMLRMLAEHFGARADAAIHPLGHVWSQLNTSRRDLPATLRLYQRIANGVDGPPAGAESCSLLEVFEAIVQYRNDVRGHGGPRFESFYEQHLGPLLLGAANEILAEGVLHLLGPPGSKLVYLTEIRTVAETACEVSLRELVGVQSERLPPIALSPEEAAGLVPNRVAILWPGHRTPVRLDPLIVCRESETGDDLQFLNSDHKGKRLEFLSYLTGAIAPEVSLVAALRALLGQITGQPVDEQKLNELGEAAPSGPAAALAESARPRRVLGDYEILAEIGSGGMGVVYLARQISLGRLVALKMLPAHRSGDEVALARFRREMRALALCEHPHIVKILASGVLPDGQWFYSMEYVPGADLEMVWRELAAPGPDAAALPGGSTWSQAVLTASRKLRVQAEHRAAGMPTQADNGPRHETRADVSANLTQGLSSNLTTAEASVAAPVPASLPLTPLPEMPPVEESPRGFARRVAEIVRDAALALQAVHERHIVHRDVKPANLMLSPDGARVLLMDFGVAKGQSLTLTAHAAGGLLGTLRYAAPEQLAAATRDVGPPADVRGLGVTLWELLTRRRLFAEAQDEKQLADLIADRDVPLLRRVDPNLDRDLEAIVARATERSVENRIPTAGLLAEYLQFYLDGLPLPIRPPGTGEQLLRLVWRNPLVTGLIAAVIALLIGGTGVSSYFAIAATRRANDADRARISAKKAETRALQQEGLAKSQERMAKSQERLATAMRLAAESRSCRVQSPPRSLLLAAEAFRNRGDRESIPRVAWQNMYDALDEVGGRPFRLAGPAYLARFDPAGRWLVTVGEGSDVQLWDAREPIGSTAPLVLRGHPQQVRDAVFSPSGRWLATASEDHTIRVWDLQNAGATPKFTELLGHDDEVLALAFSPDSRWLASGDQAGQLGLWDLQNQIANSPIALVTADDNWVGDLAFSPDDRWLASGGWDEVARLWKLAPAGLAGEPVKLTGQEGPIEDVEFSPDSRWLAACGSDIDAYVWDLEADSPTTPIVLEGHEADVSCVRFSPDGAWLATASSDGAVRLWTATQAGLAASPRVLRGHAGAVGALAFSPDSRILASSSSDQTARLWDLRQSSGLLRQRDPASSSLDLRGHEGELGEVAFHPERRQLVTVSQDATARVWSLTDLPTATAARLNAPGIKEVSFTATGRLVALGESLARVWNVPADASSADPNLHTSLPVPMNVEALSPGGRWLVIEDDNGWQLVELAAPESAPPVQLGAGWGHAKFSAGDKWLVLHKSPNQFALWNLVARPLQPPQEFRTPAAIDVVDDLSSDGRWLAVRQFDLADELSPLGGSLAAREIDGVGLLRLGGTSPTIVRLAGHKDSVKFAVFSPRAKWLVTGDIDGVARLWNLESRDPAAGSLELADHGGHVMTACFTRDEWRLITADGRGAVRMWSLDPNPAAKPVLLGTAEGFVSVLHESPDGHWLATAGLGSPRLWDLTNDHPESTGIALPLGKAFGAVQRKEGDIPSYQDVVISPGGEWLAAASDDNSIHLWNLDPQALISRASAIAGREFTAEERSLYLLPNR